MHKTLIGPQIPFEDKTQKIAMLHLVNTIIQSRDLDNIKTTKNRLCVVKMWCYMRILKTKWTDRITKEVVLRRTFYI